ncbi:olfactomedin-like protein 3A [Acipenser oxyrinchus oxyrinchus]|uniref:Olfactomedin-like protein 3A n=1 Tax=Acipenser oxyrinchus oxyrinchus TaxID=40147 RepID=A0AAD8CIZ9_ACIOX|nr:olfactomedin-like protein 3A [Acipenser oxyrinchus oxyrinchus]
MALRALCLLTALTLACAQHQTLMEYIERRILSIEDRISAWHDNTNRYAVELREFKQQIVALMETLEKERQGLRSELDNTNTRVERMERELDFLETQNHAPPCVEVDDKLVEQQVRKVKEKNKAKYERLTDCRDMISSIKSMKILKRLGGATGMWAKDPVAQSGEIYVFNNSSGDTLHHFKTVRDFAASAGTSRAKKIKLPFPWGGTGHTVYDGHVYYVKEGQDFQVIKYNLKNETVVDSVVFPAEEQVPVYGLSPETFIDLAVDEEGLWAIYATKENEKNICLAKMDPKTLAIEEMWDTPCPRENAEAAFVICGTVYVVYNTKLPSRSRVQCVFDVSDMVTNDDAPLVYFPRRYSSHASLKYNPRERQIYAWDDGYQILYKLVLKKKLEV